MNGFKVLIIRLLAGALLILTSIGFSMDHISKETFLFCLKYQDEPLKIVDFKSGFKIQNNELLNTVLNEVGVINIEYWIPNSTDKDKSGDIYLNRIYRAYIHSNDSVDEALNTLLVKYPLLYAENEYIRKPYYQPPNDPSVGNQCSIEAVNADRAWKFLDSMSDQIPNGRDVILASVDTGVDYTHPDLKYNLWINQAELESWVFDVADLDGDQYVSAYEIEQFLVSQGLDQNGDGEIDLRDFVFVPSPSIASEQNIFFNDFDEDGNGYINDLIGWDTSGSSGFDDQDPYPKEGASLSGGWSHGTHVAGILGASTNNGVGIASPTYNAKILSVKTSRDGVDTDSPPVNDAWAGITYAAKTGHYAGTFTIINNSWGGLGFSNSEQTVVNVAHNTYGAVVLSAAGNGSDESNADLYLREYPSGYKNCISVCAVGCSGNWGGWATYHQTVDLAAPGENVLSSIIGNGYDESTGSSMASPNAASVFGLLKAYMPDLDNDELIDIVLFSADDSIYDRNLEFSDCKENYIEGNHCLGRGMVDAYKSVASSLSPQVMIDSFDFNITQGGSDGAPNPGDSFNLTISFLNEQGWQKATDLNIEVSCENEHVQIFNNQFAIAELSPGDDWRDCGTDQMCSEDGMGLDGVPDYVSPDPDGTELNGVFDFGEVLTKDYNGNGTYDGPQTVQNQIPVSVSLDIDMPLDELVFSVEIDGEGLNGYAYQDILTFSIPITYMQTGFPYASIYQVDASPLVVDIDGDGSLEIIFGDSAGIVNIITSDGQAWPSEVFPYDTGSTILSSPASADLDLDGVLDFVITSTSDSMYIFDKNGLKVEYQAGQSITGTPCIGNIDGDPELEVFFGGKETSGFVFAVNHDGQDVEGFPVELNEKIWFGLALYDLNGNGLDDIVAATEGDDLIVVIYDDGSIRNLLENGSKFKSSPSIVDINGDIIITAGSYDDMMHAVNLNGDILFQIDTGSNVKSSSSFVDIDGDVYAFFGSDDEFVYAVDMNGNALEGWPVEIGEDVEDSVLFTDFDNDGYPEVVIVSSDKVYVYRLDGSLYDRFPVVYDFPVTGTPSIYDFDDDGDFEILVGSSKGLIAYDVTDLGDFGYASTTYWSQHRAGNQRRGSLKIESGDCSNPLKGDLNCDTLVDVADIITVVGLILGFQNGDSYKNWSADLNEDDEINISDITLIVNFILN